MSMKALERHLEPLQPFLQMDGVTEICINQPRRVFVERQGVFTHHEVDELEYPLLQTLAALVAEFNSQDYPVPLVSGSLPNGERVQFVLPPATEAGKVACSIRRHQMRTLSLIDYEAAGSFAGSEAQISADTNLTALYRNGQYLEFIKQAILARKNILICGGTGTGKTTFLNACLKEVPKHERLITVEDTREVSVDHTNVAHLLFNDNDAAIHSRNIFKACLRLRPDRIFLSELRGAEVWSYLRAANSGHPGSISTVHADTSEGAFQQIVFMMQQAGSSSTEEQLMNYIKSIIHVVVQLKRDPACFVRVDKVWFGDQKHI